MKEKFKKSGVDLTDLAIGIIVLGIAVSIGSVVLISMRDSRLSELSTFTVANEQVTPTGTGVPLARVWFQGILHVTNSTGAGANLTSGNYTVSANEIDGTATFANTSLGSNSLYDTLWNVTYTCYNSSRADFNLPNEASIGLGEFGNWFKIIVIVGVASVVLALIFMAFGKKSGGEGIGGTY